MSMTPTQTESPQWRATQVAYDQNVRLSHIDRQLAVLRFSMQFGQGTPEQPEFDADCPRCRLHGAHPFVHSEAEHILMLARTYRLRSTIED